MAKLVECVPNFSEGRRKEVVQAIADSIKAVRGVKLLDVEMDANHNRAVITFVGDIEPVKVAAFEAAKKAVELIDMEKHKGEHPRVGALDVLPFVPISATMDECVAAAKEVGGRIAKELNVPIYLYGEAATRPERKNLPDVRKGEYEGLKIDIEKDPARKPDYGPSKMHPSAGASIVGARPVLIAYNVDLDTKDVKIAKGIAKKIREKDGGFPAVRALGFELKDRGLVQVSMNLVNYKVTPVWRVFDAIKIEADRLGVRIVGSEIVGLVPLEALAQCADRYLKLENFRLDQTLEVKLWE
jgi:glutamate formiminotransferase